MFKPSTLRERQLAFAICCGMPSHVVAEALGIPVRKAKEEMYLLRKREGYESRAEFAINVNAAVTDAYRRGFVAR